MTWLWILIALVVGIVIGAAAMFAACVDDLRTIENINRWEDGYGD